MISEEKIKIPTSDHYPTCCIVIGMAGSGKTTFIEQIQKQIFKKTENKIPFMVNLDPAVSYVPYNPLYDIRNKLSIKDVMKQYNLGPNGAILTSLNLFSTQFDQVVDKMESQRENTELFVVDTPGQIEVFSWSASGSIITQMLATSFPSVNQYNILNNKVIVYVVDLSRCQNPNTFMSNMMFCCSILFKLRLPMVVVFNKTDVADPEQAKTWLKDCLAFSDDISKSDNYLSSLSRSLAFALDEFYGDLNAVYVSALTGQGFDDFFKALDRAREEYFNIFLPDLENQIKKNSGDKIQISQQLKKFQEQFNKDKQQNEATDQKIIEENAIQTENEEKQDQKVVEVNKKFEEFKIEDEK